MTGLNWQVLGNFAIFSLSIISPAIIKLWIITVNVANCQKFHHISLSQEFCRSSLYSQTFIYRACWRNLKGTVNRGARQIEVRVFTHEATIWEKVCRPGRPRDPVIGGTVNRGLTVPVIIYPSEVGKLQIHHWAIDYWAIGPLEYDHPYTLIALGSGGLLVLLRWFTGRKTTTFVCSVNDWSQIIYSYYFNFFMN